MGRACQVATLAVAAMLLGGCPHYGMIDDGSSMSWGATNAGKLINAVRLPRRGRGFHIPQRWSSRGLNFGTDELVALVVHMGERIAAEHPGSVIAVGDISPRRGGRSAWHRSHQSGLDVDLVFFVVDSRGRSVAQTTMLHFDSAGVVRGRAEGDAARLHFDVERNWSLVKSALENPIARVQYIFLYDPLRQLLLDYAHAIGESADLLEQASHILRQPGDSAPHDDHFHLRIYCPLSDRALGCRDRGLMRWTKKDRKYVDQARFHRRSDPVLSEGGAGAVPAALLGPTTLPFRGAGR